MVHPENASDAVDRISMLVADLGEEAASLAVLALDGDAGDRLQKLRQLGLDLAALAEAGSVVLRNTRVAPTESV